MHASQKGCNEIKESGGTPKLSSHEPFKPDYVRSLIDEYAETSDGNWIRLLSQARKRAYQRKIKSASDGGAAAADAASTKDFGAESSSVVQMQKVEKIKQLEAEVARLSGPSARVSQLEDMINRKQKLASLSNQSITEQMADAVIRLQTAQKNPFK